MEVAAPDPGRRVSAGAVVVLLGFLVLAPPVFVLGPLAALLAVSRPATWRERIWLGAAVVLTSLWLVAPGDMAQQVVRAAAMGLTGATLAVALSGRQASAFRQSVTAAVAAALGTLTWVALLGTGFEQFQSAVAANLRAGYQQLQASGSAGSSPEVEQLVKSLLDSADAQAGLFPGLLLVLAVAGTMLAWGWLHRIAQTPVGPAPGRWRDFRFNDQVIWGAIFTLALWLAPVPGVLRLVAANLLVVWLALYLARGLAVAVAFVAESPLPLRIAAAAFAVFLQPFSSGALLAVGLADTWLDFRRRSPPVPGGHEG